MKNRFFINFSSSILLVLFFFLSYLSSCYYDSEEVLYPELPGDCDTTGISFNQTIIPILQNSCWSCHSNATAAESGNSIFLENYDDVVSAEEKFLGAINHAPSYSPMPKGAPKLDPCLIHSVEIWFNNGATVN